MKNLWMRATWLSALLRKSMFRDSMFYRHTLEGSGRSQRPTLKKVFALAGLFILLAGCLQSEPIQSETTKILLDTPSAGWQLAPLEAWETDEAIYCLFQLNPPQGLSAQVITSIVSEMQLPASEKLKKHVVLGKTWNWSSDSDVEFLNSLEAFKEQLGEGARIVDLPTPKS